VYPLMPTAEELRALSDDVNRLSEFVRISEMDARSAARVGDTYFFAEAPKGIPSASIEKALKETFPGCSVMRRTFTLFYRVSWA